MTAETFQTIVEPSINQRARYTFFQLRPYLALPASGLLLLPGLDLGYPLIQFNGPFAFDGSPQNVLSSLQGGPVHCKCPTRIAETLIVDRTPRQPLSRSRINAMY